MSRITITLHIDIPDGARVQTPDVDYADSLPPEPPHLMEAPVYDPDEIAHPVVHSSVPSCPDGHGPMKYVPGGVSKRTNKPYDAFYGCNDRDCKRTAKAA